MMMVSAFKGDYESAETQTWMAGRIQRILTQGYNELSKGKRRLSDFIIEERKDRFSVFFFFYDIESHVRM